MLLTGVIGAGHLGKIHLKLLKSNPRFQLIGFFDTDPVNARMISEELEIKTYESAQQLMDDCQALIIASPTATHYTYAMEAIQKGKHLFIEKPLAATVEEAEALARAEMQTGLVIQIGHVERFNPAFKAAIDYIHNPLFIESHRLAQFNPRGTDVSVIHDLMIHDIDIMLSVVKSAVCDIRASGVAVVCDTPDIANARIEFENGCTANLTASRISIKNMRKTRFFQPNAYISVDFLERKTSVIRLHERVNDPDPFALTIDLGEKGKKQLSIHTPEIKDCNAIASEHEEWIDAILYHKAVTINARAGLQAVRMAHRIAETIKPVLSL